MDLCLPVGLGQTLSIYMLFPTVLTKKHILLFLILLFPGMGILAQPSQPGPLTAELGIVISSTNFGSYLPSNPATGPATMSYDPVNYRLGLYLSPTPDWQFGLSVMTNTSIEEVPFNEPDLQGNQTVDHWGDTLSYTYSKEGRYLKDFYLSMQVRRRLFNYQGLELTGMAGLSAMQVNFSRIDFHTYEYFRGFDDCCTIRDQEGEKIIPGVIAGLILRYRLPDGTGVFVNGSYHQGFGKADLQASERLRYASMDAGMSLGLNHPVEEKRRNTFLLGIGYPFSLSYERLLFQKGSIHHSLRAFAENYLLWDDFYGGAYNIKFGRGQHFLIGEAGLAFLIFGESVWPKFNLGYEFRAYNGLVLRADGGAFIYSYGYKPAYGFQVHIGYAI